MYLFQIEKVICLKLQIYLSQIAKFIGLKLQKVFVSHCKIYLFQIVKCICLKFQNIFAGDLHPWPACRVHLSKEDGKEAKEEEE